MSENMREPNVIDQEEKDLYAKVEDYKNTYQESAETAVEQNSEEKVIQIVMGEEGLPSIKYNGSTLTLAEVIGILEMSKDILMKKTIDTTLLQQNMYNMLQGLSK